MPLTRPNQSLDQIRIHQLELRCIVGIRPRERQVEQSVVIDIQLGVDTRRAARSGRIGHTVDYALVEESVTALLRFRRYQLIESAAEELCAMLIGTHSQLEEVRIRIEKPQALAGKARAASVEVKRLRRDFPTEAFRVSQAGGALQGERLWRSDEAELSLVTVPQSACWQANDPGDQRRLYWLVSGRLRASGQALETGAVNPNLCQAAVPWVNEEATEAVLFCCLVAKPTAQ